MPQHIVVTAYNPEWPNMFEMEAEKIRIRYISSHNPTRRTYSATLLFGITCELMRM